MDPRPFLAAHLLSSCASSCFSCSFPLPPSLSLSPSLHFTLSRFVRLRSSFWRRCSPVLRTATRANITTGSSRGHGVTVDGSLEPFLRSPGIITGPPWGFTRPEVRHQRDTCSTLTIIAAQARLLSSFVRSLLSLAPSPLSILVNLSILVSYLFLKT